MVLYFFKKMAEQPYLFLIPDIGGFTRFVAGTEAEHSEHLTAELLECLIEAGKGLELRELEGDAVFFSKPGPMPAPADFMEQIRSFYVSFHTRLKEYERNRICDCGACRSVHTLTLKIVSHYGKAGEITVGGLKKLHGREVILVHRLLKNGVPIREYALMSEPAFNSWSEGARAAFSASFPVDTTAEEPEGLDPVNTVFVPLEPLKQEIPEVAAPPALRKSDNPVKRSFYLDAELTAVYLHVFDLGLRQKWNKGIRKLDFDEEKVHRLGTTHLCHLDTGMLQFQTVQVEAGPDEKVLAERSGPQPMLKSADFVFRFKASGNGTDVSIEAHPEFTFLGNLLAPFVRPFLKKTLRELQKGFEQTFTAA